jgi:hypothetical protein
MKWSKGVVSWTEGQTAFVSVPFTWNLPKAYPQCVWLSSQGYKVRAGGPAVSLIPEYLAGVAQIGGEVDALPHHNAEACFTTRGCIRHCSFCAVPKIEGDFKELATWTPRRLVCDNNILAASNRHFNRVIDSLVPIEGVDFNQGLDARLLTAHHLEQLARLRKPILRFAWDDVRDESVVFDAINRTLAAGFPHSRITVYVLIGNSDTPEDALYRLVMLRDILKVTPFPMRFQPLYALKYNEYVAPGWTSKELKRMMRYWSRQSYLSGIPYAEFVG